MVLNVDSFKCLRPTRAECTLSTARGPVWPTSRPQTKFMCKWLYHYAHQRIWHSWFGIYRKMICPIGVPQQINLIDRVWNCVILYMYILLVQILNKFRCRLAVNAQGWPHVTGLKCSQRRWLENQWWNSVSYRSVCYLRGRGRASEC